MFEYYPQFYHKTDKVGPLRLPAYIAIRLPLTFNYCRTADQCILSNSAKST